MGLDACLATLYATATRHSFPPILDANPICSSHVLIIYITTTLAVVGTLLVTVQLAAIALTGMDSIISKATPLARRVVHQVRDLITGIGVFF